MFRFVILEKLPLASSKQRVLIASEKSFCYTIYILQHSIFLILNNVYNDLQVIAPGQSFIYGSGTVLNTPTGSIEGGFHVIENADMGIDFETRPLKERYDYFLAMIEDEKYLGENFKAALPLTACRADVPCYGTGLNSSSSD